MASARIRVALGEEELAWARARAKRLKTSISAVVAEAIRERRRAEASREVLDWLLEVNPRATSAELEEIEREWRG